MSLRLISKRNKQIQLPDGTLIPWIMGAEGAADPADDVDTDADDDPEDDDDEDDSDSDSKSKDPKDQTASELEKMKIRMKAADRRAADAEKKIREAEDKDKSELELKTRRVEELETENTALQGKLQVLTRERHFLGSNTVTWHDPEIAMGKLDWAEIVDDDGEVDQTKLGKAINDLAKEKPFLVKSDDADDDARRPANQQQSSGGAVGSGKRKNKGEIAREELLKRFPALR